MRKYAFTYFRKVTQESFLALFNSMELLRKTVL